MKAKLHRVKIPARDSLEKTFPFISDPILRVNVTIAFQYLLFLVSLHKEYKLPGPVIYSLYKDVILYTASVTESCINFCLKQMIDKGVVESKEIMGFDWKREKNLPICRLKGEKRACGVLERKSYNYLTSRTNFIDLNRAAKRADLFDDVLFNDAEKIRKRRNKIHLAGLEYVDDMYKPADVVDTFDKFQKIVSRVEEKLKEIGSF